MVWSRLQTRANLKSEEMQVRRHIPTFLDTEGKTSSNLSVKITPGVVKKRGLPQQVEMSRDCREQHGHPDRDTNEG